MTKLFQFLISGCWHRWAETARADVKSDYGDTLIGIAVYCKCEKCGKPKRFNLY